MSIKKFVDSFHFLDTLCLINGRIISHYIHTRKLILNTLSHFPLSSLSLFFVNFFLSVLRVKFNCEVFGSGVGEIL